MRNQTSHEFDEGDKLLGDWHPLLAQLGSTEGLVTLQEVAQSLELPRIESLPNLICFLECYRDRILLPLELPVIHQAYTHASRNEARELIVLDQATGQHQVLSHFASASQRVGQAGLRRLRPLRDERLLQRYLRAVDAGRAHGWHTVVHGLTLALYSWPIRQGLLHYSRNSLLGFLHPVAQHLDLSESDRRELTNHLCQGVPATFERLIDREGLFRGARGQ